MSDANALPVWEEALERFRAFLAAARQSTRIVWLFREDFYSPSIARHVVRWPLPAVNPELAQRCYGSARERRVAVELRAQFQVTPASAPEAITAASLFVPADALELDPPESSGLAFSLAAPFGTAASVGSRLAWFLHRQTGAYRLNQRQGFDIPRRAAWV
ncbi:MAG: hypothetical protein ACQGVK_12120 [Myxococcota bacterium]